MAIDKDKNTQVLLTLPLEMLKSIEDYQFKNRINNRSEAIRKLLTLAIEQSNQNAQT